MSWLKCDLSVQICPSGNRDLTTATLRVIDAGVGILISIVVIAQDISILSAVDGSTSAAISWTTSLTVVDSGSDTLIGSVAVTSNDRILVGVDNCSGVSMSGES